MSSLSTTVNCTISVFIYLIKHGKLVISLIVPDRPLNTELLLSNYNNIARLSYNYMKSKQIYFIKEKSAGTVSTSAQLRGDLLSLSKQQDQLQQLSHSDVTEARGRVSDYEILKSGKISIHLLSKGNLSFPVFRN